MTGTVQQKRAHLPKRLTVALEEILKEAGRPVEILELEGMAEARGFNTARSGKNFYILAKSEEAAFVVDEYPSYKLRSQIKLPVFDDVNRGVQYPAAAAKVLIGVRDYVGLMEIVQSIKKGNLYTFPVSFPEYWMYHYLNEYREHFSLRGALKIGLKEWRKLSPLPKTKGQAALWEGLGGTSSARGAGDMTPKMHEANLETIIVEHLDKVEEGLKLIQRQYVCPGVGRIDVLCEDRSGNLVVIELKKFGVKHDSIIDQVARYMGYVKNHVAQRGQDVRGILVVAKADDRLRYAVSAFPGVEIRTFNLTLGPA